MFDAFIIFAVRKILKSISDHMAKYTAEGILVKPEKPGMVLLSRTTKTGATRTGLVTALDLEMYDYSVGSQSKIRPTEATIESRIPPRLSELPFACVFSTCIFFIRCTS